MSEISMSPRGGTAPHPPPGRRPGARFDIWLPVRLVYRALVWVANSPRALFGAYLGLIAVGGALYSHFEHKDFQDSLWWAVVTASTVGYGDTYPTTGPGRLVAGILISTMVLLVIPLITAHFASKLIVDQDAFRHEEQEEIKNKLREVHAMLRAAGYTPPGAGPPPPGDRQPPAGTVGRPPAADTPGAPGGGAGGTGTGSDDHGAGAPGVL